MTTPPIQLQRLPKRRHFKPATVRALFFWLALSTALSTLGAALVLLMLT